MSPRKRPKKIILKGNGPKIDLPEQDNMDIFQISMVLVFFASSLLTFTYFESLDLSVLGLLKMFCLFVGLSFLIPISFYRRKYTMSIYEYLIFNLITFGPFFLTLILSLNMFFTSPTYKETYRIIDKVPTARNTVYTLEENAYDDKEYLRSIGSKDIAETFGSENLSIYFSDGLFGIRIVEKKRLH